MPVCVPSFTARVLRRSAAQLAVVAVFASLPAANASAQSPLHGALAAHDPSSIVRDGKRYFMFATGEGILSKYSDDRIEWFDGPPIFATPPAWTRTAVPGFTDIFWAPDVMHFAGLYHLYYSVSTFGSQVSAIGLATSPTLDPRDARYGWTDHGPVIQSTVGSPYNTIDPALFQETNGNLWMTFGSYWDGIYTMQLDPATGRRLAPSAPEFRLADYPQIEASHMLEHEGDYFLFVNWGSCCSGVQSTYNIRVGRGESALGPFRDRNGNPMTSGAGSSFLAATGRYRGPGHASVYQDDAGEQWFTYHYYDALRDGDPAFDTRPLEWGADGWPLLGDFPQGDYDGDLSVDGSDFLTWQRNLGSQDDYPAADGNDDGAVTAADLNVWRSGFAASAKAGATHAAPEPATLTLLVAALGGGRLLKRKVKLPTQLLPLGGRSG